MNREVTRGDTPRKTYKLFNLAGGPLDLSGCTVWLTVKQEVDNDLTDSTAYVKNYMVVNQAGVVTEAVGFELGGVDPDPASPTYDTQVDGPLSGLVTHVLPLADSNALPVGTHVYDLQVMGPPHPVTGNRPNDTPVLTATFTVRGDVTRRTTTP